MIDVDSKIPEFETLDDLLGRLPAERSRSIRAKARKLATAMDAALAAISVKAEVGDSRLVRPPLGEPEVRARAKSAEAPKKPKVTLANTASAKRRQEERLLLLKAKRLRKAQSTEQVPVFGKVAPNAAAAVRRAKV